MRTAGILGWIRKNDRTDLSIMNAIEDGMEKVIIYSCMKDAPWYYKTIEPIIRLYPDKIKYAGCVKNKQEIYDSVSDIYDMSASRISMTIKKECDLTGTKYHA